MTKVVRVRDSDYKIVVGSTGSPANIILDTNPTGVSALREQLL